RLMGGGTDLAQGSVPRPTQRGCLARQLDRLLAVPILRLRASREDRSLEGIAPWGLGIEAGRPPLVGQRLIELLLRPPCVPPVEPREDILGLEPDRLGIVGDRLVVILMHLPGMTPIVVSLGRIQAPPDRRMEIGDRSIEVPLSLKGDAP